MPVLNDIELRSDMEKYIFPWDSQVMISYPLAMPIFMIIMSIILSVIGWIKNME